jgi:hypothetical protein
MTILSNFYSTEATSYLTLELRAAMENFFVTSPLGRQAACMQMDGRMKLTCMLLVEVCSSSFLSSSSNGGR